MLRITKIDDKNVLFEEILENGYTTTSRIRAAIFKAEQCGGNLVEITPITARADRGYKCHFSEIEINGTVASSAADAVTALNQFIGNFKTGGGTPSPTPTGDIILEKGKKLFVKDSAGNQYAALFLGEYSSPRVARLVDLHEGEDLRGCKLVFNRPDLQVPAELIYEVQVPDAEGSWDDLAIIGVYEGKVELHYRQTEPPRFETVDIYKDGAWILTEVQIPENGVPLLIELIDDNGVRQEGMWMPEYIDVHFPAQTQLQIEVGSEHAHLNLNTDELISVDKEDGTKEFIAYASDLSKKANLHIVKKTSPLRDYLTQNPTADLSGRKLVFDTSTPPKSSVNPPTFFLAVYSSNGYELVEGGTNEGMYGGALAFHDRNTDEIITISTPSSLQGEGEWLLSELLLPEDFGNVTDFQGLDNLIVEQISVELDEEVVIDVKDVYNMIGDINAALEAIIG